MGDGIMGSCIKAVRLLRVPLYIITTALIIIYFLGYIKVPLEILMAPVFTLTIFTVTITLLSKLKKK